MIKRVVVLLLIAAFFCGTHAYAWWGVKFESKTVSANEDDVECNLKVFWEIPLTGFAIPVVVREIDPGSFWTGALPYDTGGNAYDHPFQYNVSWNWTNLWANLTEEMRPGVPFGTCSPDGDTGYDGISPDHFSIHAAGVGLSTPAEPDGRKVVTITFDVTGSLGEFEFDTACFSTSLNTIYMVDNSFPPVDWGFSGEMTFVKGVITIDCYCGVRGDVDGGGGAPNPLDVSFLVKKVYQAQDALFDYTPTCPYDNGDVDCSGGAANPLDVSFLVKRVYQAQDALCARCP